MHTLHAGEKETRLLSPPSQNQVQAPTVPCTRNIPCPQAAAAVRAAVMTTDVKKAAKGTLHQP
eukprot:3015654-Rhodomonas_salina.1